MNNDQKNNQISAMEKIGTDAQKLFSYFVNEANVSKYINQKKGLSFKYVEEYLDNSLDFVYIDISNDYESILREIKAWLPKLKPGAILGGDDYSCETVARAVNELLIDVKLSDIGFDKRKPEEFCSWYIIK